MKTVFTGIITSLCICLALPSFSQVMFEENATELGCSNTTYGAGTLGGGISFYDFDNDGWDDITISSEEGKPVRFFKNNQGSFTEIYLDLTDLLFETKTVQWVDFDNDGDNDLFVTSHTDENVLYENIDGNSFVDVTAAAGLLTEDHSSYGASWGDYNKDGYLDVFVSSRNSLEGNFFFENNGDGTFTNVTSATGIIMDIFRSFCSAFFDYNNDGWQDIFIANDKIDTENQLYRNNGDGTFTEVGAQAGINFAMDAMSTTIGDYNQDGWMDVYVSNTFDGNVFFKNNGDGTFTDIAAQNGTLMETWAWGSIFFDPDNDADVDLYVSAVVHNHPEILSSALYLNDGNGNYTIPEAVGLEEDNAPSFANALGDINNDGYPDMTVLNYDPNDIFVWENTSNQDNNWIKLKLEGVESNRQGVGSLIEIAVNGEKQYNYTLLGEGFLGQNSAYEFFGIGAATTIDYIKVTWLSGTVDIIENPEINTHNLLVEGSNILGRPESYAIEEIEVFPNPTAHQFTIRLPEIRQGQATFVLSDMNGRIMSTGELINGSKIVRVQGIAKGLYLLQVALENKTYLKKVVIN